MRTLEYDDDNNLISEIYFNEDGSFAERCIYHYADNKMVEALWYKDGKHLTERKILKYDTEGNNIETVVFEANGKIQSTTVLKYDNNNKRTEETTTNKNGIAGSKTFKYNSTGQLSEEIIFDKIEYDNPESAKADTLPLESYRHIKYEYATLVQKTTVTERGVDINNIDTETYLS